MEEKADFLVGDESWRSLMSHEAIIYTVGFANARMLEGKHLKLLMNALRPGNSILEGMPCKRS